MLHRITDSRPSPPVTILPSPWADRGVYVPAQAHVYEHPGHRIRVLSSIDTMDNGSQWLHVSCSRPHALPSWEDLKKVKRIFIGPEVEAYQVLPKESEYVNAMPYCMHLWAQLADRG